MIYFLISTYTKFFNYMILLATLDIISVEVLIMKIVIIIISFEAK